MQPSQTQFFATICHDIKSPLASIIGLSELLSYRLDGENQELAEALLQSGQQLMRFVESCLESAKLEADDAALMPQHFKLTTVLDELNELFKPTIKEKRLNFEINYDDRIPSYLVGNRRGVYRILLNLISNAFKFTHSGTVSLSITKGQHSTEKETIVIFDVADTGIGIPADSQQSIFERFTRLTPVEHDLQQGIGLGLHLVENYVAAMQGEVLVSSEEGRGSHFKVILPFTIPLLGEEYYSETRASMHCNKHPNRGR